MKQQLQAYLAQYWNTDLAVTVQYAPIPKDFDGDMALGFFVPAKVLSQSPLQVAQDVKQILDQSDLVTKTEIKGPYLNITFEDKAFFSSVAQAELCSTMLQGKTIVIEFSGPNTNKPLHLGHMRNHALGIAMSNVLENCGADVKRVNIINDRGVHICKSLLAYQKFGNGDTPESTNTKSDQFVGDYYIRFEQESKKDESLKEEVQRLLQAWENKEPEVMKLWEQMNDWALTGHAKTYARQGVKFVKEYRESDYYEKGKDIAHEGLKQGVFYQRKDNAIMVDLEDDGLDQKVVLRGDGTSIYLTQDLAVDMARKADYNPDTIIHVVADEQNYHFKVLFLCLEKLGLMSRENLYHLGYGLVHLPDGRMKSREGNVVDADTMMDELSELAMEQIKQRHDDMKPEDMYDIAEAIMNASWKFYLLTTAPKKSITFEKEKSIAFEGATGPYLQYAGVRIKSLLRKAGDLPEGDMSAQLGNEEKPLGNMILRYQEVLEKSAETYNPTYMVMYLLELAQTWSRYYANISILSSESGNLKNARLQLAKKVLQTLEHGLQNLGISIPDHM